MIGAGIGNFERNSTFSTGGRPRVLSKLLAVVPQLRRKRYLNIVALFQNPEPDGVRSREKTHGSVALTIKPAAPSSDLATFRLFVF